MLLHRNKYRWIGTEFNQIHSYLSTQVQCFAYLVDTQLANGFLCIKSGRTQSLKGSARHDR
jgi:hypothetical protein